MQSSQPVAPQPVGGQTGTVPQVAWQFVVQYYTYMNDKPEQLHRFYTKNSYQLHGVEGEDTLPCQGQQEIHQKFSEIDFQQCKVFIHSVDAQPSANSGILVHVIGEMSNKEEAWRKFVQVFFLAEQANGYFVLNDNFRYLKEESFVDDDEGPLEEDPTVPPPLQHETIQANSSHHNVPEHSSYAHVHTNGYRGISEPEKNVVTPLPVPVEEPVVETPAPRVPTPIPEPVVEPAPAEVYSVPEVVEPKASSESLAPSPIPPSPVNVPALSRKSPSPAPPVPEVSAAPTPPAPAAPKTWANLAATNSAKWGHTVAQESKGVSASVTPAAAPPSIPTPTAVAAVPVSKQQPSTTAARPANDPMAPGGVGPKNIPPSAQHPLYAAALAITTTHVFVKGVTENIPQNRLEEILTQRFGPIKDCEVVRSKACAFIDFKTLDGAKKAIIASLGTAQGGEGGVRLGEAEFGSPARVNIEVRKERGDRPISRPRGGAPPNENGRGANQGSGQNNNNNSGGGGSGAYRGQSGGPRGGQQASKGRGDAGARTPKT